MHRCFAQRYANRFRRAGERAASLGARAEAGICFARAAELADEPTRGLSSRARPERLLAHTATPNARPTALRAIELFQGAGDPRAAARANADLAFGDFSAGKTGEAIERLEQAYADLGTEDPDENLAYFLSQLARWLFFAGRYELSNERNERALEIAEHLRLPEVLSHTLNTKGLLRFQRGTWRHRALCNRHALQIALENAIPSAMPRGYTNLSVVESRLGNLVESEELILRCLDLARKIGDREQSGSTLGNLAESDFDAGKWDEVVRMAEELPPGLEGTALGLHVKAAEIARHRGDVGPTRETLESPPFADSPSFQDRSVYAS